MKLGMLAIRLVVGGLMIGHGTQKLFGWFGGHGPEGTGQFFASLGLVPGKRNALLGGVGEAGGGALLAAGLCTPSAGAALTGSMATAVRLIHGEKGPWVTEGGWEYNAVIIAAAFAVTDAGPGPLSVDALLGRERWGLPWAVAQLAAGAAGAAMTIELGRREAAKQAAGGGMPATPPGTADASAGAS